MGPGPFEEIKRVLALAVKLAVEVQPLNDEVSTQHFSLEGATEALDQNSEDRDLTHDNDTSCKNADTDSQ